MAKEDNHKKIKEKYMEMQLIEQQVQKMHKQIEAIEEQMEEIMGISASLSELAEVSKGSDALIPVANGIFIKAKIEDTSDVYMNVGSNTNVKKSLKEAVGLIDKQKEEMKEVRDHFINAIETFMEKAKETETELKSLIESEE